MLDHRSHSAPAHSHHEDAAQHAGPHVMTHEPVPGAQTEYARAFAAAQPEPGHEVVQYELVASQAEWSFSPGITTIVWAFNGQIPGPIIEAAVGDVLELRLTNHLPEPTTIHWHGLRLPAAMDGTDIVQRAVAPGETFTYRFRLLDAGTFWYHPHSNEAVQMERGLYGALIVRAPDEPAFDRERVLVLDDVKLEPGGQVAPTGGWREHFDGREGDTRLINGIAEPELMIWGGQVERWRIVNAASARYVRLTFGGQPFRMLGTGGGFIEAPLTLTEVLLAPGERVDLAVGPFESGDILPILSESYDRGSLTRSTERFGTLLVGPSAPSQSRIPERLRTIVPLVDGPCVATREVRLSGRKNSNRGVDFLINDELHHRDESVIVGELQIWDVVNESSIDHPFHLHGFFFQVLERNGQIPAFRSWEDTINVPARGRVRIAWMPDDRPGEWMYHCHILEHHAAGMMAHFSVVRR